MMKTVEAMRSFAPLGIGRAQFNKALDEVEREISERYMPLPLDADGVPWNFTETRFVDPQGNNKGLKEISFNIALKRWELLGSDSCVSIASQCCHAKPRTVQVVLEEFYQELDADIHTDSLESFDRRKQKILDKYAAELQMRSDV